MEMKPASAKGHETSAPSLEGANALQAESKRAENEWWVSEEWCHQLFESAPDAMVVVRSDGQILAVNAQAQVVFGYQSEEMVGKPVEVLLPERFRERHVAYRTDYFSAPAICLLGNRRLDLVGRRHDGAEFPVDLGLSPVKIQGDTLAIAVIRDITEREQTKRRLTSEHGINRILAASVTLQDAAPKIIQTVCESLDWDFGTFWLLDRNAKLLRCCDLWQTPMVDVPAFERVCRQQTISPGMGVAGRVWDSRSVVWIPDVTTDLNCPRAPIAAQVGLHGAIGFPIGDGPEFGVMEFFSREVRQPDEELMEMMKSIGHQISQFMERRRAEREVLYQEEDRRIARLIQQRLLPKSMPSLPGFQISGRSATANEVGGDCFDFIPLLVEGQEHLGVLVADASGHGIGAALLVGQTRAYLRALALTCTDVGTLLTLTNRRLASDAVADHFVSLFLMRLDPRSRSVLYASAGHWPGYVLDRQGQIRVVLVSTGGLLGIDSASQFLVSPTTPLEPDELVFLFTDGIVEAASSVGQLFGLERTLGIVQKHQHQTPDEILEALFNAVSDFSENHIQDDRTAVIIKVEGAA
jgi:PAS domain S-box-containing protein